MADQEEISCAFLFRQPFWDIEDSDERYHEMRFSLQLLKMLSDIAFESDPTMKESLGFLEGNLSAIALSQVAAPTLPLSDLTTLSRALPEIMKVARNAAGLATGPLSEADGEACSSALKQAIAGRARPPPESWYQGEEKKSLWHDLAHDVYFDNLEKFFIPNFDTVLGFMSTCGDPGTDEYKTALRTEAREWSSWKFRERTVEEEEKDAQEEGEAFSSLADNIVFAQDSDGAVSDDGYITISVGHTEEPAAMSHDEMIGDSHLC